MSALGMLSLAWDSCVRSIEEFKCGPTEIGPILLDVIRPYKGWIIGFWDGEVFHDRDFRPVTPVRWTHLPD